MEIVATPSFLDGAKEKAGEVEAIIRRLSTTAADGTHRAEIADSGTVYAYSHEAHRLSLLFAADSSSPSLISEQTPPLSVLGKSELRELGVPDPVVKGVQAVRRISEIDGLGLPEGVASRLRFKFLQLVPGARLDVQASRRALGIEHLSRYLHGDITQLLLDLDEGQRRIVELDGLEPVVVRGVAGSGKTSVLLHRIHELLDRHRLAPPTILLLTFNRALASAASELLAAMGARAQTLEVSTFHKWCIAKAGTRPGLRANLRDRALKLAREAVRARQPDSVVWSYAEEFWRHEVHLIKGRILGGRDEYLQMERTGAGRALREAQREVVWSVYEEYERVLGELRACDWDDTIRDAYRRLVPSEAAPAYEHVLVDEAQDLTAIGLRLAAHLARRGTLFLAFDPAQSIFERGFRFSRCGIKVHAARSFNLRRNYRNTRAILRLATPLLTAMRDTDEEAPLERPELPPRQGEAPRILETRRGGEPIAIARDVAETIRGGVPPENMAVLCYHRYTAEKIVSALQAADVNVQLQSSESSIRLTDPSVKVLTLTSAKGLEFPVIYLWGTDDELRAPASYSDEDEKAAWADAIRKTLYMALTRAMSRVVLVHEQGKLFSDLRECLQPERR